MAEVRQPHATELQDVFDLRWRLLREPLGLPRGSEQDEYDFNDDTIHAAAFVDDTPVATGRMNPTEDVGWFHVRYMATEPNYRGQGFASEVLKFMEEMAAPLGGGIMLNARPEAVSLYRRSGYTIIPDEELVIHGILHSKMRKNFCE